MSDIEKRYDELEEAILTLNMQINETTDKYVKEIYDYTDADIKFVHINTKVAFEQDNYSYKDEFLKDMTVDKRLKRIKQEVIECGKEENDRSKYMAE